MIDDAIKNQNKQESPGGNTENTKYREDIKDQSIKLKEIMESLGYKDLTLNEFVETEIDRNADQSVAARHVEAKNLGREILEAEKRTLDTPSLIKLFTQEKSTEFAELLCLRIVQLRGLGNLVEADELTDTVKKEGKKFGVTAKTIDCLIEKKNLLTPTEQKKHEFPFDILGFNRERKILLWHKGHLMHIPILSLFNELKLFLGPNKVTDGVVNEIIFKAYQKNFIEEEEPIKLGIWQLKEWNNKGKILIISGRGGIFYENGKYTKLVGPVVDERIVYFEKHPWIDLDSLKNATANLKQTFSELRDVISQWPWKHPDMADWMSAFVMLLPFQQLMRWRPWLWLDGPSNSGKSALFEELLEQLYGLLLKRADKATAHSLAQGVGCTSKIAILDEFEKFKHNEEVLNMCKIMNRGGAKTSGTPGDREITYTLHHMPIFGSIYLPRTLISDQSQRNRIVRFSLKKIQKGKRKKSISDDKMNQIGVNIIASMLAEWEKIEVTSKVIQGKTEEIVSKFKGELSSRAVENFMYAAAILEIVKEGSYNVPEWARQEQVDDGRTIIEAIIRCKIRDSQGADFLIQDLIEFACGEPVNEGISKDQANKILRLYGLKVVSGLDRILKLAIRPEMVSKEILKNDSDFHELDISAPLERIIGSEKKRTSWGEGSAKKAWAIQVPIVKVLPDEEVDSNE